MNFRIENWGHIALIGYSILATTAAVALGGGWYHGVHQAPRVVTKTRIVKQANKPAASASTASKPVTKVDQSSVSALTAYKLSEQKLKTTAIQYAKILQNYSPSVAAKRAALKSVATPDQINQLAP